MSSVSRSDEKVRHLQRDFQEHMPERRVAEPQWKSDHRCWRFYFREGHDWKFILDVDQDYIEDHDASTIVAQLESAKWQQVLQSNSGKQVPLFKDGRFSEIFREWPKEVTHRRG